LGGDIRDSKIDWVFAPFKKKHRWRVGYRVTGSEEVVGDAKIGDWGLIKLMFVALPEGPGQVSIAAVGLDYRIKTFFTRHSPSNDTIAYMRRKESTYGWRVIE